MQKALWTRLTLSQKVENHNANMKNIFTCGRLFSFLCSLFFTAQFFFANSRLMSQRWHKIWKASANYILIYLIFIYQLLFGKFVNEILNSSRVLLVKQKIRIKKIQKRIKTKSLEVTEQCNMKVVITSI